MLVKGATDLIFGRSTRKDKMVNTTRRICMSIFQREIMAAGILLLWFGNIDACFWRWWFILSHDILRCRATFKFTMGCSCQLWKFRSPIQMSKRVPRCDERYMLCLAENLLHVRKMLWDYANDYITLYDKQLVWAKGLMFLFCQRIPRYWLSLKTVLSHDTERTVYVEYRN